MLAYQNGYSTRIIETSNLTKIHKENHKSFVLHENKKKKKTFLHRVVSINKKTQIMSNLFNKFYIHNNR